MSAGDALLPTPTQPGGLYHTVVVHAGIAYVSGHLPRIDGRIVHRGKVGADCSVEEASAAAGAAALSCLASLSSELGSLERIERVLKLTGFVACGPIFDNPSVIVDAASQTLIHWLGARGEHARSAIGVAQLPCNVPVEIEMVCAVRPR